MAGRSFAVFVALLAGLVACGGQGKEGTSGLGPTPVRVEPVRAHHGSGGVRYSATVTPFKQVDLDFKVVGYVAEILLLEGVGGNIREVQQGDLVREGQVLARIRDSQYRDKLEEAEAQLGRAVAALRKGKADFTRASNLFATQSITAPDYDQARKEYESAVAEVAGARARVADARTNLEYTAIAAPMDGVILQRTIEVGQLVRLDSVAFQLADLSSVKVVFGVPDVMLETLRMGSTLRIATASLPDRAFEGEITAVAPSANPQTRVFETEVTVRNPGFLLLPGMIASLEVGDAPAVEATASVPLRAIVRSQGQADGYAVYVVQKRDGGTVAQLRDVELGDPAGNEVVVQRGLKLGEQVVVRGAGSLHDGAEVRVIP